MRYLIAFLLCLPRMVWAEDLTVFAAASLKEPLDAIAATAPGVTVSYAGSGTLARQVLQGAPADVVILAHPDWMVALSDDGAIVPDSRVDLLSSSIVLVGAADGADVDLTPDGLRAALGSDGRLAIGMTASVPAGIYGRQALENLGLWAAVSERLAETDNVRAALALAARGEVPLALTYATDARVEPALRVVARFPTDSHDPILYQAAVVSTGDTDAARAFLTRLGTPEAQAFFRNAGFDPLDAR